MKSKLIFALLFCSIYSAVQAGGPWATGKGKAYTQLGASFNQYTAIISTDKIRDLSVKVTDNTYQFYGEFGITNKISVISNIPFKTVATAHIKNTFSGPIGNLNGLGNICLAGKYSFWEKGVNLAAQVQLQGNNRNTSYRTGLRTGYSGWAVTPSIIIGKGFKKWYAFADLGVALRSSGYSEDIISNAEIGYTPFNRFWLALAFSNKNSLKNGTFYEEYGQETALYVNNQSYNAFSLKVSYGFTDKYGINLSANGAFAGDLVGAAPTFCGSFYYKFLGKSKQ